ncbi:leukocyte immunoglobulin-like receptor subfamily A member 2 isoform X2 [Puma concolor]|uniref:Leukocyte immunoglobulin-like receptor subfamily A member 2 isoform X2 n=1 Tax=Puma concolor TaxID=9696 RepID=A0A6P6H4G2_PUMCO|nr:leukocyte immunoglobulin-like receptor subfamily A member 2 isoform X2 [Puma concolor]
MGGSVRTQTLTALLCLGNSLPGLCRGPWDQVQARYLPKPSIRADPSPNVTGGTPVTIWCQASLQADVYYLYKERVSEPMSMEISQESSDKASFSLGFTSPHNAGRYQCQYHSRNSWSQRSDLLPLVVTGVYNPPSLSAIPGPVVASGGNVSLSCSSPHPWQTFRLLKEGGADAPRHLELKFPREKRQALFPVGPVSTSHGGTYRCYVSPASYPYVWSLPSDPLHLQVTGLYRKPSLSAQPGPSVSWGENVTLQCRSEIWLDAFYLSKEGSPAPPQHIRLQDTTAPYQVSFNMSPVTSDHEGTYRCYASSSTSPYLLSHPSDPLELLVSAADAILPSQNKSDPNSDSHSKDYTVENLIRMGMAGLILVVLGILLFWDHSSQRRIQDEARR